MALKGRTRPHCIIGYCGKETSIKFSLTMGNGFDAFLLKLHAEIHLHSVIMFEGDIGHQSFLWKICSDFL